MSKTKYEFDYIKLKLASPIKILQWSYRKLPNGQFVGEIQKSETINYRTFKPEMDGLFCERIFGPNKNLECACGKYKLIRYEGLICDRCGVELTESRVRRHRMGHINLIYPVTHVWYMNSRPNYMALLLEVEQCEKRLDTGLQSIDLFYKSNFSRKNLSLFYEFKNFFHSILYNFRLTRINFIFIEFEKLFKFLNDLNNFSDSIKIKNFENPLLEHSDKKKMVQFFEPDKFLKNYLELQEKRLKKGEFGKDLRIKFNELVTTSNTINLLDGRIKRIKLASLSYFIADSEISFYGLHWDLQHFRRSRELGFSGYPLKPYAKPNVQYKLRFIPKYLLTATPNYLIGSVLIKRELEQLNLLLEIKKTRKFIFSCSKILNKDEPLFNSSFWFRKWELQRIYKLRDQSIKRIRILENLVATGSNPSWMLLTILPVIPPALRPMIQLENGRFATSDLNELYRRIITRNNRLLRLLEIDAPQLIIRNEKRMLQEAVDTLIDNGKRGKIALSANNRPLKSLSDIIKGKHGRFRQNLLGKRVDYSGRSVIIVGPNLKLNQCGLPYGMAVELFQPFIIRELINQGLASNMKIAKNLIQQNKTIINSVLEKIFLNHPIFLNRAPTLHRLGIQAFEPILVNGKAIKLHPLVCSAFNADFDGDQMAVHIPLSLESQSECYMLMLAPYNFLSPANGEPIIMPSQDMILGCYYLTVPNIKNLLGSNHYFANFDDVILAYNQDQIELHTSIWVRTSVELEDFQTESFIQKTQLRDGSFIEFFENKQIRKDNNNDIIVQYIRTTTGRVIFNNTVRKTLDLLY